MVCITHTRNLLWTSWSALDPDTRHLGAFLVFALGRLQREAVVVFFVLSGYLVGGRCLAALRTGSFAPRRYAIDRLTRVYPPYLAALALTALVTHLILPGPHPAASFTLFLGHVFFLQGPFIPVYAVNSPLWSLAYEAWFYVLAGAIATLASPVRHATRAFAAILLAASLVWLARSHLPYLACWMAGALAYSAREHLVRLPLLATGLTFALFGAASLQLGWVGDSLRLPAFAWIPGETTALLLFAGGVSLALPRLASAAPAHPRIHALEQCGRTHAAYSFSLYLIHQPLLDLAKTFVPLAAPRFDLVSFTRFIGLLLALLASAWLFSLLFERATNRLRLRFARPHHSTIAP